MVSRSPSIFNEKILPPCARAWYSQILIFSYHVSFEPFLSVEINVLGTKFVKYRWTFRSENEYFSEYSSTRFERYTFVIPTRFVWRSDQKRTVPYVVELKRKVIIIDGHKWPVRSRNGQSKITADDDAR